MGGGAWGGLPKEVGSWGALQSENKAQKGGPVAELELSSLEFGPPPGKAQAFITFGGQSRPGPRFP